MAQFKEKKYPDGLLNADDDFSLVAANEIVNGQNLRFGSTDNGATGRYEKIKGNELLFNGFDYVASETFTNRGSVEDKARGRIIFFAFHNDAAVNHGIYAYDQQAGTTYTVLKEEQVVGGLGITLGKYIDSARVWGDLLYWTNGLGEPKVINIESGIKLNHPAYTTDQTAYVSGLKQEDITLIKRPCIYPLGTVKKYNVSFVDNYVYDEAFQFAVLYEYYDGQESVLSSWSALVPNRGAFQVYNYIRLSLPSAELIPQTVRVVKFLAKNMRTNTVSQISKWDRDIAIENVYLTTHNNGGCLGFDFYNNIQGEVFADAIVGAIEHQVPRLSETLEVNTDRLFLGNNTFGYASPTKTSLGYNGYVGVGVNGGDLLANTLYLFEIPFTRYIISGASVTTESRFFRGYFVYLTGVNPGGWYALKTFYGEQLASYPAVAAPGATLNFYTAFLPNILYMGKSHAEVRDNLGGLLGYVTSATTQTITTPSTIDLLGSTYELVTPFKTNASYNVGIVFYDRFNRTIGMYNTGVLLNTSQRVFGSNFFTNAIEWYLSNTNALTEIPDDAYYYSIIRTNNLRTRFFINGLDNEPMYAKKNTDGTYTMQLTESGAEFVAINTSGISRANIGYVYTEGDQAIVSTAGGLHIPLKVVGQIGKYILLDFYALGTIVAGTTQFYYELFTLYKPTAQDFYYEVGNKFAVTSPGQAGRVYSQLTGILDGDCSVFLRTLTNGTQYYVETMNARDQFWKDWFLNNGKPVVNIKNKVTVRKNSVVWSNQRFLGVKINGSSVFEINNEQQLAVEAGQIRKFQIASRLQGDGGVMLSICERETLSVYVGRAQMSDENSFNLLLKTDSVIGTVNGLRGSFGTKHPESVVEHRGNVYWFDVVSGSFIKYSGNGLFDISSFKFKRPTTLLAERMRTPNLVATVTAFKDFVPGGVDVKHDEVLWTIPKTYNTPPKGRLSDYADTEVYNYPYDIYDGLSKTLVFKINADKWATPHTYVSEGFSRLNNELFCFYLGKLYRNNATDTYNNFFGTTYTSRIAMAGNESVSDVKVYKALAVEATIEPVWAHFRTEWPYTQSTELIAGEWKAKEGVYYGKFYKDRLSPNTAGTVSQKMVSGDDLKGQYLLSMLEFSGAGSQLNFRIVTLLFNKSLGHKV